MSVTFRSWITSAEALLVTIRALKNLNLQQWPCEKQKGDQVGYSSIVYTTNGPKSRYVAPASQTRAISQTNASAFVIARLAWSLAPSAGMIKIVLGNTVGHTQ